ncbi:hypothetical protein M0R45_016286 [Rubus argutus]|uniref:Uncharacterized protein n=1 Tax=Rubus argutus TaxID=59490 RepID=A0AAW1XU60_RUBAR
MICYHEFEAWGFHERLRSTAIYWRCSLGLRFWCPNEGGCAGSGSIKFNGGVSCGLRDPRVAATTWWAIRAWARRIERRCDWVMKKKKEHGFRLMRKTWMLLFSGCNASTIMCWRIVCGSTMLGLLVPVSTCISILEWIISELDHQFLLDNAYYFEMKDAGFFDADWD